ncbi:MAG: hypothetical protein HRU03_04325 [Nanoarchaeales archaeon]|nr:hypothetical protein [Nanoarchaeales archaeon]
MIKEISMNLKKILSVLLIVVLCCGFGFAEIIDLNDKSTYEKKNYVAYLVTQNENDETYTLEGFENINLVGNDKNVIFTNFDKAKLAYDLGITNNEEINKIVQNPQSMPNYQEIVENSDYYKNQENTPNTANSNDISNVLSGTENEETTQTEDNEVYYNPDVKVTTSGTESEKKIEGYGAIGNKGAITIYEGGDTSLIEFSNKEEVALAKSLNLKTGAQLDSEIKKMQDKPLDRKNKENLIKVKKYIITEAGYQSIATENRKISDKIKIQEDELKVEGITPNQKADILIKIKGFKKELRDNQKELNNNPPTVLQQGKLLASLSDKERLSILEAINKKECSGSYVPYCEFFLGSNSEQATKASFIANLDSNSVEIGTYNDNLVINFKNNIDVNLRNKIGSCTELSVCKTKLAELRETFDKENLAEGCTETECINFEDKLDEAENLLKYAEGFKKTDTNWVFSVFDAIKNQDQMARSTAKFFGFGADYDNLPRWLNEQGLVASRICIAEMDGYLDDDSSLGGTLIKDSGSLTKYSYDIDGDDYGRGGDVTTLDIVSQINGKMTKLTPDGKVAITLSVYLKAPETTNLTYMLGIGYKSGDEYINRILNNESTIKAGDVYADLIAFYEEIENPNELVQSSFFLYMKVRTGSGTVVLNDNVNIYLVEKGTELDEVLGNSNGHNQDSTNDDVEQDTDTFWNDFEWNNG